MLGRGRTRVVILGAGFGGLYTALHLERRMKRHPDLEVVLVSRDNYFQMTPLLFEAGSGVLEARHAVSPIRTLLDKARFIEAEVEGVDVARRVVKVRRSGGAPQEELEYDHLVLALGGVTNKRLVKGSEHAMTFKTLSDAIFLRNHVIDLFERADAEGDPSRKQEMMTFVVIGAGLVGVELIGELTEFVHHLRRSYPRVKWEQTKFHLIEAGPKVMPEMERDLADFAVARLRERGVEVLTDTKVDGIDAGGVVHLPGGRTIHAETVVLATGVTPSPLLAGVDVPKDPRGKVVVDGAMKVQGHRGLWALGDCAAIPGPDGKPYPPLAQHALREARVLADNIVCEIEGKPTRPFVYQSLGVLASLGHFSGVGRVLKVKVRGFPAWWVWRTYYLMQMPRWERRIRIMFDWTIALLFKNDIVKLDMYGDRHPTRAATASQETPTPVRTVA